MIQRSWINNSQKKNNIGDIIKRLIYSKLIVKLNKKYVHNNLCPTILGLDSAETSHPAGSLYKGLQVCKAVVLVCVCKLFCIKLILDLNDP